MNPVFLKIPVSIPRAYWDGYFSEHSTARSGEPLTDYVIALSNRRGEAAQSDARYVIDRCASGLHFGITFV